MSSDISKGRFPHRADITTVAVSRTFGADPKADLFSCLVMIYGESNGKRFEIKDGPLSIGRAPNNSVQLKDDSVSRHHCRLLPTPDGIVLVNLGSTNGTFVNGEAVLAQSLRDQDRVTVGRSVFKFLSGENIERDFKEEIYRVMTIDGLTGAYNRAYFERELQREVYRYQRYKRPLALLMLDIDNFGKINDRLGHPVGDRILSQFGPLVRSRIRDEDVFARWDGGEFALMMPEMDEPGAIESAERLRRNIDQVPCLIDSEKVPLTISIGVAVVAEAVESVEDLVRTAKERLSRAKENGRNRTEPNPSGKTKA
jgi:diguanylate cyclase (GGDEF)-like protein